MKIKSQNLCRVQRLALCLIFGFLPHSVFASDLSPVENNSTMSLEKIFVESGPGLDFTLVGKSLLVDQNINKVSKTRLEISLPVKRAFLVWSGEVKEQNKNAGKIHFLGPGKKSHKITAQHLWKKNSTGILYSALADVTPYVKGSGSYGVKNLASDVVNPGGKDPYSVAGWALIVLTENRNSKQTYSIAFLAGLEVLKPGEIYDLHLKSYLPKGSLKISTIGIIGGHGRAGNGSGNLLNKLAISGQDDWDGSAGKFWDIDLFSLNLDTKRVALEGKVALTIDPLLQWLYPIGVVLRLRSYD